MHEHSDWYRLFAGFWWLIFPLFAMAFGMVRAWLNHKRAQQGLEILKSYIDQGKEPPPELLKLLQSDSVAARERPLRVSSGLWIPTFLFTALSAGFLFLAFSPSITEHDNSAQSGLTFVAILMGGLAMGFLVAAITRKRAENQDRLPRP